MTRSKSTQQGPPFYPLALSLHFSVYPELNNVTWVDIQSFAADMIENITKSANIMLSEIFPWSRRKNAR